MKKKNLDFCKLLSIIISIALICTGFVTPFQANAVTETETDGITHWSGVVAEIPVGKDNPYKSGNGTRDDPYVIANGEQLACLTTTVTYNNTNNKYYKLANDIYLNDITEDNWYGVNENLKTWMFKDSENEYFAGNFNGAGHTIYGLYISGNNKHGALFGAVGGGAVIENLRISKSYISSTAGDQYAYFSALAAFRHGMETLTIRNCVVDNTVQIAATNATIGAFIGYMSPSKNATTIENCYSGAKISKKPTWVNESQGCMFVGGRTTNASSEVKIKNSYAIGDFKLALSSDTAKPTITNSYTTYSGSNETGAIVLTEAQMSGAAAKKNMNLLDYRNIWCVETDKTPMLRIFCDNLWNVWSGTVAEELSFGSGTKDDPYLITNGEELAYLADVANANYSQFRNKYYKLTDDIYLNDVSADNWYENKDTIKNWTYGMDNSKSFVGYLDGDGHTIYGLYAYAAASEKKGRVSLFGSINAKGRIENLGIARSYIYNGYNNEYASASAFAGERMGWTDGEGPVISNCYVDYTVQISASCPGGFVGYVGNNVQRKLTIANCYSRAQLNRVVDYHSPAYSFVGCDKSIGTVKIENCWSVGDYDFAKKTEEIIFTNCFTDYESTAFNDSGIAVLSENEMFGRNMVGLNFDDIWRAADTSLPQLRKFKLKGDVNSDGYINLLDLEKIKEYLYDHTVQIDCVAANLAPSPRIDEKDVELLERMLSGEDLSVKSFKLNRTNVKVTEGSEFTTTGVAMNGSASSVEFTSIGSTKLYFNGTWRNADNAVYFTVYINGARQAECLKFEAGSSPQLIASRLESTKTYTIKLVRETEEKYGDFIAHSISTKYHGRLITRPSDKKLHIEFIGDSITCGLGSLCGYLAEDGVTVLDTQNAKCGVSTAETALCEDATNSYAYIAAQTLNADCSMVSKSGLGITGTWGNEPAIEYYNNKYNRGIDPDLVVINLGTNDWGTSADITSFKNGVKSLINRIREIRGEDVTILWTTGLMGNAYKEYTAAAINELGYDNVYHFTDLTEGRGGHNGHPTKEQAAVAARELVDYIVANGILSDKETALAGNSYAPEGYNLVWYDSFSAPVLDSAKWVHINSAEETHGRNYILSESNFVISDDNAVLTANQEADGIYTVPETLSTRNRMAFKYGYLEMRAKVPYGNPMWPSFWLQSNRSIENSLTEYMTEIDIFEVFGNQKAIPNIHKWINGRSTQANNTLNGPLYKKSYTFTKDLATLNSEYHIYGFLIDETEISFFIDGEKYATVSADDVYWGEDSKGINDYFYVLHGLKICENSLNSETNNALLPANYCVDYVRLYQNSKGSIFYGQLPK